uniref:Scinderin like a n=1 Tax=Lates calcarifer TaxID=8187 RepID=A0A4W6CYU4_LATCA
MATHKAFETAGKEPGLQVWRVEKMDLKPVPAGLHGDFFTGDCYIVLYTTPAPSYNVHSWLGNEASQDERGCAAIFMTQLDDSLGGAPRQYTEFQNQESVTFMSYFKSGVKYKKGGVASGFQHVVTNDVNVKRLLHVKGRRTIRATEVDMSWHSFNKGDCFIIDLGKDIYHWSGSESNSFERLKTTELALDIRDNERKGRAEVHMIEEGSEPEAVIGVLGPKPDLPPGSSDDASADKKSRNQASLYLISDAAGSMKTTIVAEKNPFKQDMLSHSDCYILDNRGDNKIFIWKGGEKVPVDPSTYGQFFGGDCYLVLYSYNTGGKDRHIIYTWQGQKCSKDELAASAFLTVNLDDSMGGAATQVRVTQGQEPPHLVSLFKDKPLVIHLGGTSRESGQSKPASTQLFHIRQSSTKATRAVEPTASSLNTNDVFVLKTPNSLMQWKGKGATPEEMAAAKYVATLLGGAATEVEETKEPDDFWKALGGKKPYQTSKMLQNVVKPPRLFGCSNKTGRLIAEEVPGEFTQMDLATDDVMILDTWAQIFVWVGKDANETEKTGSPKIAEDYVNSDPSGRRGTPISIIKQGEEPLSFIGWFHGWDAKMWDTDILQRIQDRIAKH